MSGFDLVGTESNGSIDGKQKTFAVDAAHAGVLGPGDLVLITGDGSATGVSEVDIGTANAANTGVISSVKPTLSGEALSITHLAATTAGNVLVNVDAFATYEVAVSNGPLVVANVGLNCPAVVTAGTVSGSVFNSNMGANATGVATTSTLPLHIVALKEDSDGVLGNRAIVRINESTSKLGATGIA
jgi:hypothetical protein